MLGPTDSDEPPAEPADGTSKAGAPDPAMADSPAPNSSEAQESGSSSGPQDSASTGSTQESAGASSASSIGTGGRSSLRLALLRAVTLRSSSVRPEERPAGPAYRGDDVLPFWMDLPAAQEALPPELPSEVVASAAAAADGKLPIPASFHKRVRVSWPGLTVALYYVAAFIFYIIVRAAFTLNIGAQLWYGVLVLGAEILGGINMLSYALCITLQVVNNGPHGASVPLPTDAGHPGPGKLLPKACDDTGLAGSPTADSARSDSTDSGDSGGRAAGAGKAVDLLQAMCELQYHVRVVVPCYREPLEVVSKTVHAALLADLPPGCSRTVYLLDDGKDPVKKNYVRSLHTPHAVYISGRTRAKGEINGKSGNINHALRHIYPEGVPIPLTEVVAVFDADQVPCGAFFLRTLPLLDGGRDVAMVLSPQTFYNVTPAADIFNHANIHFYQYSQTGFDALGLMSCTGTNFLLRSRAFSEAGWFPEWTLTEDFALGIELRARGWQCRYVAAYLVVGEAPEEVRNCFQQRSRWAKGHFQVFFSRRNPVVRPGLSPLLRAMYGCVLLTYASAVLGSALMVLVPVITVWFGAFPIAINLWAAIAVTVYYSSSVLLMRYTRSLAHIYSMYFAGVSSAILSFAFLKAWWRTTLGKWLAGTVVFKVTAKGSQKLERLPLRDVWVSLLVVLALLASFIYGLWHVISSGTLATPVAISLVYMAYASIPHLLLLQYAMYYKRPAFVVVCKLAIVASAALGTLSIALFWKTHTYVATPDSEDAGSGGSGGVSSEGGMEVLAPAAAPGYAYAPPSGA